MAKHATLNISADLQLPADTVTSTLVVLGGKGMGKTNLGGVLIEELSRIGQKWSVIDPMGVWWGVRHSEDGKGKGVECLILGGVHGDIPIEPTGGAVVADLVADENANVIIDISRKADGKMWSIGERIRFMHEYGQQLYMRQGSLVNKQRRPPMMQLIDEVARFIPQVIRAGQPDLAQCASTWSTIVEEGRNVGLGVALLTQRSARLNKDVAELADLMLAFRTIGPNSLDAVMDWLDANVPKAERGTMRQTVRSLPIGHCLAVSPGWLQVEKVIAIRKRETFDSSATPKAGQKPRKVQGDGAKPDLAAYAERMKETIERAKNESVPALQKRIRELEAAAAKVAAKPAASAAAAAPPAVKIVPDPKVVTQNEDLRRELSELEQWFWSEAGLQHERFSARFREVRDRLREAGMPYAIKKLPPKPKATAPASSTAPAPPAPAAAAAASTYSFPDKRVSLPKQPALFDDRAAAPAGDVQLGKVARQAAGVVAGYYAKGKTIKRDLLAALLGKTIGGSFAARLSEAQAAGMIVVDRGTIAGTDAGLAAFAGQFEVPETTQAMLDLWLPKLGAVGKQILQYLVDLNGDSVTRADLAAALGQTIGGSFAARLSEVRGTGLITESGGKIAANAELLFL